MAPFSVVWNKRNPVSSGVESHYEQKKKIFSTRKTNTTCSNISFSSSLLCTLRIWLVWLGIGGFIITVIIYISDSLRILKSAVSVEEHCNIDQSTVCNSCDPHVYAHVSVLTSPIAFSLLFSVSFSFWSALIFDSNTKIDQTVCFQNTHPLVAKMT